MTAEYDYRDESGRVLYRLLRFVPKDFAWVRPDGRPWKASRRPRLLYRLPELLAADRRHPVFVVEGERDVDRLLAEGLIATCNDNGGGVGKWCLTHCRPLRGRNVIILPDNDRTGDEHAQDVGRRLYRVAAEVRIIALPGLRRKQDVSDWLDASGQVTALIEMAAAAPIWRDLPRFEPASSEQHLLTTLYYRTHVIESRLDPVEKLLLIILLDLGERRSPPQRHLAHYLNVSERRVRQLVAGLQKRGVLRVRRYGGKNYYSVHI